jgi:GNAT superfamily N-acetyltransferase
VSARPTVATSGARGVGAPPRASATSASKREWRVRTAGPADDGAVALAVRELLVELGGEPPALERMREAAGAVLGEDGAGAALLAEAGEEVIGVLAASWQVAIHAPGAYALIQDLWVHPRWRSQAVGAGLLDALFELAAARGFARVEVGLPRESFARFAATEAFYLANGFAPNGPRMRRALA